MKTLRDEIEPVRRRRIYREVVAQIRRLIADGRIQTGECLPPERELAEMFAVSRTSVRDAIRILEMEGIVEPRQGEGTVVKRNPIEGVVRPVAGALSVPEDLTADLFDMRMILEPPLARAAALCARREDIEALEKILEAQAAKVQAGGTGIEEDTAFHYRLATVSKNRVIPRVMDVLMELLLESRRRSLQGVGRAEKSLDGHRRILAAVKQRDGEAAAASMRQHLEEIEAILFASSVRDTSLGRAGGRAFAFFS